VRPVGWTRITALDMLDRWSNLDTTKAMMLVEDEFLDDNKNLIGIGAPQAVYIVGHLGNDGVPVGGDSAGRMPVAAVEASAAAILGKVTALEYRGAETVTEVQITTGGGGDWTGNVVAAPPAGNHLRITSLRTLGVNLAGGTFTFATVPASVLLTDRVAAGRASSVIDAALGTATALGLVVANGGAATVYTVEVTHVTEAD